MEAFLFALDQPLLPLSFHPPIPELSPREERQAPVLLVPDWALCWVCMNAAAQPRAVSRQTYSSLISSIRSQS